MCILFLHWHVFNHKSDTSSLKTMQLHHTYTAHTSCRINQFEFQINSLFCQSCVGEWASVSVLWNVWQSSVIDPYGVGLLAFNRWILSNETFFRSLFPLSLYLSLPFSFSPFLSTSFSLLPPLSAPFSLSPSSYFSLFPFPLRPPSSTQTLSLFLKVWDE